ncbi:nuclear transport factor 2 family protein [Lysobacter koreensis]|uniref:Nuclear transport factor 2 family protein n=1 Tax=Lysobacter koreensis TaxID=266122 RepID=A0ABW2YMT2_9GAMM
MKLFFPLLACLLSSAAMAQPAPLAPSGDVAQIEAVVEAFRAAIIDKDKPRFVALFVPGRVTWQSVRGDDTLRMAREKNPQAAKVSIDPNKTHLSFIDGIVAGTQREEEKFRNVKIVTDGDIASVTSDYSFHQGERETNHGQEAWHLVRTDGGWKIASVIWSVNRTSPLQH